MAGGHDDAANKLLTRTESERRDTLLMLPKMSLNPIPNVPLGSIQLAVSIPKLRAKKQTNQKQPNEHSTIWGREM